jgi:5-hydroxyisourate hydrolase-like protein (transthyretin family)
MRNSLVIVALAALFVPALSLAKDKTPLATVNFLVVREKNGKPIRNASVVIAKIDGKGRQKQWGQELKTNGEGKTQHPAVEYGKVRIQVIATGFQTYGEDYDINQETMDIVIKLKLPQEQHSIYK